MLDYEKLSKEFTMLLSTFDKDHLTRWLVFDKMRLEQEALIEGRVVDITLEEPFSHAMLHKNESISTSVTSNTALAA